MSDTTRYGLEIVSQTDPVERLEVALYNLDADTMLVWLNGLPLVYSGLGDREGNQVVRIIINDGVGSVVLPRKQVAAHLESFRDAIYRRSSLAFSV